ncbi:MAG: YeeE/YedE family protein [Caldilineaceae bacterium]|nr:YeeE/YedE family protein [Caldilineaceae bacterium]
MEWLLQSWPWYISGPLIGLSVPLLLLLSGKTLGISSSFRHYCSIVSPNSKLPYLRSNDWRKESWNLIFVAGIALGGLVATQFLSSTSVALLPAHYYSWPGALLLLIGGILVGFGTRYADGCTSGHTIMGLSNLKWPSLVATLSFFAGGLIMTALTRFFS